MASILDELKNKYPDEEGVQKANNIAEGVAAMPVGGGSGGGKTIIECHVSYDEETGMATATNLGSAFDALDAIAADMSLAEKYALVITGLDDFIGGESGFSGGYCNASVFYEDRQYKPAFINSTNNGVFAAVVREHNDTGIRYYCFAMLTIRRNELDESGNYVWKF